MRNDAKNIFIAILILVLLLMGGLIFYLKSQYESAKSETVLIEDKTKIELNNQVIAKLELRIKNYQDSLKEIKKEYASSVTKAVSAKKESDRLSLALQYIYANSKDTAYILKSADSLVNSQEATIEAYAYSLDKCNEMYNTSEAISAALTKEILLLNKNTASYHNSIRELQKRIKSPVFKGFVGIGGDVGVRGIEGVYRNSDVKVSVAGLVADKVLIQADYGFIRNKVGVTLMYKISFK